MKTSFDLLEMITIHCKYENTNIKVSETGTVTQRKTLFCCEFKGL